MNKYYIYKMFDKNGNLLYIGKTKNFNIRMKQHFSNAIIEKEPWKNEIVKIERLEVYTQYDMTLLEIYLIGKFKPKYNTEFKFDDNIRATLKYDIKEIRYFNPKELFNIEDNGLILSEDNILSNNIKEKIKKHIKVYDYEKINNNYLKFSKSTHNNELSYRWCMNQENKESLNQVLLNCMNLARKRLKLNSKDCCLVSYDKINIEGFMKNKIIIGEEPSIKLKNKHLICYIGNDYITNDNELFSISYLISILDYAIKYSELDIIYLYLPSKRMRDLFNIWLES